MDKREKGGFSPPALGGSSLLVIFAVLALTVFALLSLSTVQADVRLSDASAQAVEAYYAADCKAQELLARIRNGETPDGVEVSDEESRAGRIYSYACPISDGQELQVSVLIPYVWDELAREGDYTVLRWQAAPIGDWEYGEGLNIWTGDE